MKLPKKTSMVDFCVILYNTTLMKNTTLQFSVTVDGKQIPLTGPLVDFIKTRAESYVAPTRKGTPRGEQIGMKTKKYFATLLELTSYRVKDQAKLLKVPEKLLGKWRTERGFRWQVAIHHAEYDQLFCDRVDTWCEKELERFAAAVENASVAEFAEFKFETIPPELVSDRALYGKYLMRCIGDSIETKPGEEVRWLFAHRVIEDFKRDSRRPPNIAKERAKDEAYRPKAIAAIKGILLKDEITEQDRKRGIAILKWLE